MTDSQTVPVLLDTNVFIEAHRRYYAFDIHPGFWDCLYHLFKTNQAVSLDRVRTELLRFNDALSEWVENTPNSFFVSTSDHAIVNMYMAVMNWLDAEDQYLDQAKYDFAQGADGWLVSFAIVYGLNLVTEEVYDKNIRRRVPLPNVCKQFGVETFNTFSMLRSLGIQFNWETSG